ncbi:MAG: hypothetical protein ETSY2_32835, partial [Candidatus Entotheonella gemina]
MKLPDFIVIGSQKCATSSLCHALYSHPEIFFPDVKEPHFFSVQENYRKGMEWYSQIFSRSNEKKITGEGSTSYTMYLQRPEIPTRIATHLPHVKLIYITRHPLQRLESAWMHLRFRNRFAGTFAEALKAFPYLIDTSLYWAQINRYRDHYSDEQMLILFSEELISHPVETLKRVFSFLNVDTTVASPEMVEAKNVSLGRRVDTPALFFLRHLRGMKRIVKYAPASARRLVVNALSESLQERPTWPADVRDRVLEVIRPDAQAFLQFYGGAFPSFR